MLKKQLPKRPGALQLQAHIVSSSQYRALTVGDTHLHRLRWPMVAALQSCSILLVLDATGKAQALRYFRDLRGPPTYLPPTGLGPLGRHPLSQDNREDSSLQAKSRIPERQPLNEVPQLCRTSGLRVGNLNLPSRTMDHLGRIVSSEYRLVLLRTAQMHLHGAAEGTLEKALKNLSASIVSK